MNHVASVIENAVVNVNEYFPNIHLMQCKLVFSARVTVYILSIISRQIF